MKNPLMLLFLFGIMLSSCVDSAVGPRGSDGYDGLDGLDGLNGEESYVFEYEFDFTAPEYSQVLSLPDDFTMLDSDVMLVFFLWDISEGTEIWRSIPQTLYFSDGILNYNYDFTKYDAKVFLDGTVNLDGLGADYTDNWIARVVVVPGQFTGGRSTLDYSDYNQVKDYFQLSASKLATADYKTKPE